MILFLILFSISNSVATMLPYTVQSCSYVLLHSLHARILLQLSQTCFSDLIKYIFPPAVQTHAQSLFRVCPYLLSLDSMGGGASVEDASTVFSYKDFPKQLYVEGAGSPIANGKFVLRTDKDALPLTKIKNSSSSASKMIQKSPSFRKGGVWFSKDNDTDCWIVFIDAHKEGKGDDQDQGKWVVCTAQEILYLAPITDKKATPREGRWELGDDGAAPAPTVNVEPLPAAFRLSGWKDHHDRLNGEYLPLDDGTEMLNGRPIFKHENVVGCITDKWRVYWSRGAWRVGDKDQMRSDQTHCMAFVESDASHPTAMPSEAVWKGTASGHASGSHASQFEAVEGVSLATGTVSAQYREVAFSLSSLSRISCITCAR